MVPFLENVTRGTGIPKERLVDVGEHYFLFGGRSPINDQNRALITALRSELDSRQVGVPIYWGNRNWHPLVEDTVRTLVADGHRRVRILTTSAYPSYSGCRSYREDMARALGGLDDVPDDLSLVRVGNYGLDDWFVAANAAALSTALAELPDARIVFVTHSIPTAMNDTSGPAGGRLPGLAPGGGPAGRGGRGPRRRLITTSCSALGRGVRDSPGWSPTSTTICATSPAAGSPAWCWRRSASCPITWR